MRAPAKSVAAPQTPIARRLEAVRSEAGVVSLRAFWERVRDGWVDEAGEPVSLSYEAIRPYHVDRDPPAKYLARVAEVFGYRIEWLVTGKGAPRSTTLIDEDIEALVDQAVAVSPNVRSLVLATIDRYLAGLKVETLTRAYRVSAAFQVLTFLRVPATLWGFNHALAPASFDDFAVAMLHALNLALPPAGAGDVAETEGVEYASDLTFDYNEDREQQLATRVMAMQARLDTMKAIDAEVNRFYAELQANGDLSAAEKLEQFERFSQEKRAQLLAIAV